MTADKEKQNFIWMIALENSRKPAYRDLSETSRRSISISCQQHRRNRNCHHSSPCPCRMIDRNKTVSNSDCRPQRQGFYLADWHMGVSVHAANGRTTVLRSFSFLRAIIAYMTVCFEGERFEGDNM